MTDKSLFKIFILSFLFLLNTTQSFAVDIDPVHLYADSLKEKSTLLSLAWKYHPGDNLEWALQSYDDSEWDTLRTNFKSDEIDSTIWNGIGWFRKVIKIDSSLRYQPLAFLVNQYGASEFYINGSLRHKLGEIADSAANETLYRAYNIPFTVVLDSNFTYLIAIRYSNKLSVEEQGWYKDWFNQAGFSLALRDNDTAITNKVINERTTLAVNMTISGIFLALALLYFALFIFYADRKENLYFALFNLTISLIFAASMVRRYIMSDFSAIAFLNGFTASSLMIVFPFYLGFLYSIFYEKIPKQFYYICIIITAIIVSMVSGLAGEDVSNYLILGSIIILTFEGLRVIIVAIKQHKPNSNIIGAGVIVFVLFVVMLFVLGIFGLNINTTIGIIIFFAGLLSLPISMSVYLARDIALTNKDLAQQLINVKQLSQKELEQKLRAQKAEAENERKSKELEEARQLQLSMLPKELPQLSHIDIAVYMKTATEVGGDYYDFHVGLDGTLTVVIGDATGHGMKAGTMVTAAKSIFNSYVDNSNILFTFQEFNRVIKGMQLPSMSMCLSLLKIKGNQLEMSAAGMPHALIYRKDDGDVEEIILKGMPLGAVNDFPYQTKAIELDSGDTVLLFSDGLPELFNSKKEMFGYDRVTKEYEKVGDKKPDEIIKHLTNVGAEWINGNDPDDDITFVVLKMK